MTIPSDEKLYQSLIKAISKYTGKEYLSYLVEFMATYMGTKYAFVTTCASIKPIIKFKTVAYWTGNSLADNFEYEIEGTPCELIVKNKTPKFYPKHLAILFPKEKEYGYESYHALPLLDNNNEILGHLGVTDTKPMSLEERYKREAIMRVLASRVEAELLRIKNDEEKDKLVNSLTEKNEQLRILNEEKNYFIKMLSHDLRSPLNQIKGMANILFLDKDALSQSQIEIINKIEMLTERANNMISKMLDIGSIESQNLRLQLEQINLNNIIRELILSYQQKAAEKGIIIELELNKNCNIMLDKNYFIQIFENLISNAIKFSPFKKNIKIKTERIIDHIRIEIKDQGKGISKDDMKKLFGRFQKLSVKPTNGESSTGLGLSIAKKFTEAMNGEIWCESENGKGASFILKFNTHNEHINTPIF